MNSAPVQVRPFPGGIHPPANKSQSLRDPIRLAKLPDRLIVPVTQPDFRTPLFCVQPGQRVYKGQLLAKGADVSGLASHAPAAGTVSAIIEHAVPNVSGLPELCVVIDTDATVTEWPKLPPLDFLHCDSESLIARIAAAGISGLGGAGFPAHAKLRAALQQVDTVIVNAAECEPYITADDALLRQHAADVMTGCLILLQLAGAARCLIGIEDNKPEAIAALRRHQQDTRVQVVVIPTRYPSGADRQLSYLLTGREIPSGTLPVNSGILCHNVATVYAIARAVLHGEVLLSRITTITGAAVQEPGNYQVLIGTPVSELLQHARVDMSCMSCLIGGGSLMGTPLPHAALPITRTSNCIIATTNEEMPPAPPAQACIRCGHCADVCPMLLLPQQLFWFSHSKQLDKAAAHNLQDCIECGACAWVCPSHIPLVQYYRAAKAEIVHNHDRQQRAEHSRHRYEAWLQRKAAEKQLEEQQRSERARLLQKQSHGTDDASTVAKDAVAAALARVQARKAAQQTAEAGGSADQRKPEDDSGSKSS